MSEELDTNNKDIIANSVPEGNPFKCGICGKENKNAFGLKIHLLSHGPKKPRKRPDLRGAGHRKRAAPIRKEPPANVHETLTLATEEPRATQPWRPASILTASRTPGMRPRWVRKDLLEKRIEEGWQPRLSDSKSRVESPEKTIVDGVPLGRYVTKRNLVLCDMPEEMALSRADYYKRINDGGLAAQKNQFDNETVAGGKSHSYGDIKVER